MKKLEFFSDTGWKEDPDFPHSAWQEAVAKGDTKQSYAGWVIAQHEIAGKEFDATGVEMEAADDPDADTARLFSVEDWQSEVSELNTRRSYAAWVQHEAEFSDEL